MTAMDASGAHTQDGNSTLRKRFIGVASAKLAVLASLWGSTKLLLFPIVEVLPIEQATKQRIEFAIYAILAVVSILIWIGPFVAWLHRSLNWATPWFVLVLLLLSGATLFTVRLLRARPPQLVIAVMFDISHGQVFNSWTDKYSGHNEHIYAWGTERDPRLWDIPGGSSDEASFSYKADTKIRPSDGASSGAYQTFYDTPSDRRVFRKIVFTLQSAETCGAGQADVGVRLTVDNPLENETEYFTYELASLKAKKGTIDGSWRQFEIPISELVRVPRVRNSAPLPHGLDENTINKIVFFVDNTIVSRCSRNTLRIRDVSFQP